MVVTAIDIQSPVEACELRLTTYATENNLVLWHYVTGEVDPRPAYPYAVLYPSLRTDSSNRRISDDSTTGAYRFTFQYIGHNWAEATWVQEKVYAALNSHALVVSGMTCSKMHHEAGPGIAQDSDLEDLFVGADSFTFTSTPSS